jgi:hypothetical protein
MASTVLSEHRSDPGGSPMRALVTGATLARSKKNAHRGGGENTAAGVMTAGTIRPPPGQTLSGQRG